MKQKKRISIGVMAGGVHSSFPKNLLCGISDEAKANDINTYFFVRIHTKSFFKSLLGESDSNPYDYQFNTIFDYCRMAGVDGTVLAYGTIAQHLYRNNSEKFINRFNSVPLIVLPEMITMPNCHCIISDNRNGMKTMAEHLIRVHSCRRILFVCGPENNTDSEERLQGYLEAMQDNRLTVLPSMIGHGDFSDFVDNEVSRLLDAHPDADAIMFANDEMARSGYRVCAARGIQVGKDLMITGYDCGDFSDKMSPPLTTVLQDAYGMGVTSIRSILDILNHESIDTMRYPTQPVLRASCGCRHEEHDGISEEADTYEALSRFRMEAGIREQAYQVFQGKSWFIPMIARDLSDCEEDDREFCRQVAEKLKILKANAAYLFLMDTPVSFDGVSDWNTPDDLRLASFFRDDQVVSYEPKQRPKVDLENTIVKLTDDGRQHQFLVYLLFSGEKQYGILLCDVPMAEMSLFYVVSLQIGLSMRYFEMNKQEALRRRKMSCDIETMRQKNRELGVISSYDELTQLLNRRGMKDRIREMCAKRSYENAYVIYCDMDHLKEINDTRGHQEGNQAIQAAAALLKGCMQQDDMLARFGGDEFVCLVAHADSSFPDQFRLRLQQACRQWNAQSGKPYRIGISIGIVPLVLHCYEDFQQASCEADHRMYENKNAGRTLD